MSIYTLNEINNIIHQLEELIQNGASEEEVQAYMDTKEMMELELTEKLEGYAMVITNLQSNVDGKKFEAKRLLERAKAEENAIKRMKENMQYAMVTAGQTKVKGEKFNFTVQKNPPSLKVLDENLIPEIFFEQPKPVLDKKLLLNALKDGHEYEGVTIQQGESIRIR